MNIGDLVTRKKYNHDIVFRIVKIEENIVYLKGEFVRLKADALIEDLSLFNNDTKQQEITLEDTRDSGLINGCVLHLDGDEKYLNKCLKLYEQLSLPAYGVYMSEEVIKDYVLELIDKLNPDIVIITGHDSYNKKGIKDLKNYRNTNDYIEAVKKIRKHYSKDHIFVFAGACQSNFEAIMASGANFASSPKRVNIDAYDPAVIAIKAATTPFTNIIDLDEIKDLLESKKDGISGIESFGKMRLFL